MINTQITEEAGYGSAMIGISLCHKITVERAKKVAEKLAFKDGGHNKFLEEMQIWALVQAPRYWWQEADTYRLSSKQSESTMHTLVKELQRVGVGVDVAGHEVLLKQWGVENFESNVSFTTLQRLELLAMESDLVALKGLLPEGFLQRRLWNFSYKTLRNMILQRRNHRLPHWPQFLSTVLKSIQYPELLPEVDDD